MLRLELAGREIVEGAEAAGEFVGAEMAVAVERADMLDGAAVGLFGVANVTARDEIAVGIAADVGVRDDMV